MAAIRSSICSGVRAGRNEVAEPIATRLASFSVFSVIAARKLTRRDDVDRAVVVQAEYRHRPGFVRQADRGPLCLVALHYMNYNFCRIHKTLRYSAMAAGVKERCGHYLILSPLLKMGAGATTVTQLSFAIVS